MQKASKVARHGDVLIRRVDRIPDKAVKKADQIVAEGEITGHCHQFQGQVNVFQDANSMYAEVVQPAQLVHEEHHPIQFEVGIYEIQIQQEYDLMGEVRRVQD